MSYYCIPDYWEYNYAVGDPITGFVSIPLSSNITVDSVFVVSSGATFASDTATNIDGTKILIGYSNISANTNVDVSGAYLLLGSTQIVSTSEVDISANFTAFSSMNIISNSEFYGLGGYTLLSSANIPISCIVDINGREKWEPELDTPETWTEVG